MRNLIIVFISLFTFCIGISGQQKCKLNVGSFNLRYDNEGDKDDSWVHRKDMAVSLVHFHDFDVFGIQEGLIHQVKELVKDDTYTYVGVGRDDGKEAGEHAAFYLRKIGLNYWTQEITGCRRHRISLLWLGCAMPEGLFLGEVEG